MEMGARAGRGRDLSVDDDVVYMRTGIGPQAVDVIYRRIDDEFMDPEAFRPDSDLGVRGLVAAWKARGSVWPSRRVPVSLTTRSSRLRARDHQATISTRSQVSRTYRLTAACIPKSASTCWNISTSWS